MTKRYFDEAEIAHILRRRIAKAGLTQRAWATQHGIPEQIVSDFLNARRGPNEAILDALGFNPEPSWRAEEMSRTRKPVPVAGRITEDKIKNREQLAELRRQRAKDKKPK